MASSSGSKAEFIVGGKYKLVRKIGSGSFGDIYLAINITNGEVITRSGGDVNARLIFTPTPLSIPSLFPLHARTHALGSPERASFPGLATSPTISLKRKNPIERLGKL